jgi:hypothetical protein
MTHEPSQDREPALLHILKPDEELYVQARATDAVVAVSDRRLVVTNGGRVALDLPYQELRRVQFDIERTRPATFVVVPEHPANPPEVLAIPVSEYENAARVLAVIGRNIAGEASTASDS